MPQVVFLNGPSGSGKDTIASGLVPYLKFRHLKFASPLKRGAAGLLDVDVGAIESYKDKSINALKRAGSLENDTLRMHLIEYWKFLAARYGDEVLGRFLWNEMRTSAHTFFMVSDAGKDIEVRYVAQQVGKDNCLIIRVHRQGHTFEGDNRSYLGDKICAAIDLHNDGPIDQVVNLALYCISRKFKVKMLREATWMPRDAPFVNRGVAEGAGDGGDHT